MLSADVRWVLIRRGMQRLMWSHIQDYYYNYYNWSEDRDRLSSSSKSFYQWGIIGNYWYRNVCSACCWCWPPTWTLISETWDTTHVIWTFFVSSCLKKQVEDLTFSCKTTLSLSVLMSVSLLSEPRTYLFYISLCGHFLIATYTVVLHFYLVITEFGQ